MPFPVLNRDTFERTGVFLEPIEYFNPSINTEYHYPLTNQAARGLITIADSIKIASGLLCDESIDSLLPYIARYFSGNSTLETLRMLREVYTRLPDDKKWMLFFTKVGYDLEGPVHTYNYSVSFRYPERIAYNESILGQAKLTSYVQCTANSLGDIETNERGKAVLDEQFLPLVDRAYAYFEAHLSTRISWSDHCAPGIIGTLYKYASGGSVFVPEGHAHDWSVPYDYSSARIVQQYIDDGYRVTFKLSNTGSRLSFLVRHMAGDRRALERIMNYSTNIFDHLPYTIKGPKEPAAVLYGVELEANGDYTPKELITAQKDLFFIMKQDGSVWGSKSQNYELVTVPASLKAHKRLWAEFFEKVDYQKFDTTKDTGNGMHVHIDRKAFKTSHLNRFTWFITNPANEEFILAISERPTKRNLEEWARMPNHFAHASKLKAARLASRTNDGLRGAVHFKRDKTVEVRLFKGIVSYATVVKNLEFVDSAFHYTQQTALSQLSLKHYLAWLQRTPKNKYQMLKAFLSEVKLPDLVASSEVVELIWTEKAEHTVAEKLNKAPFKLTNAHITYLNKKRRKRTFILKDGTVKCIASSGGLLAKLDKSVQQKQTRGAATFAMTNFAA